MLRISLRNILLFVIFVSDRRPIFVKYNTIEKNKYTKLCPLCHAVVFVYFQTLRVQSSEGTKRIEVQSSDTLSQLYEKVKTLRAFSRVLQTELVEFIRIVPSCSQVYEAFDLNSFGFDLCKQRNHKDPLTSTKSRTVSGIGLCHGDMLYLVPVNGAQLWSAPSTSSASDNASTGTDCLRTIECNYNREITERKLDEILFEMIASHKTINAFV